LINHLRVNSEQVIIYCIVKINMKVIHLLKVFIEVLHIDAFNHKIVAIRVCYLR